MIDIIPQGYPLYAVYDQTIYLIIGWKKWMGDGTIQPVVIELTLDEQGGNNHAWNGEGGDFDVFLDLELAEGFIKERIRIQEKELERREKKTVS